MQAVIFDLDGVLIDTEEIWDEVRRGLAERSGRPWPQDATHAMLGMSTAEWSAYLVDTVGVPGPAEAVARTVIDEMADRYTAELPLLPGAVDAVTRLADRWPLGLASSSPRRLIDAVLAAAGLTEFFEATISTEEVPAGKPSPVVYQEAVRRLGTEPSATAAIEDSSNGLRSAHAAGLKVVALPNAAFPPAADALALAHVRIEGLADVTADLIDSL